MMEAESTSDTVNFYQTAWCNSPEDIHLDIFIAAEYKLIIKFVNRNVSLVSSLNNT
jgi:hypothetical protein